MKTKICQYCGKIFTPTTRAQRYCSDECKEQSKYHGSLCIICGKPTKNDRKTCSKECLNISNSVNCIFRKPEIKDKIKNTFMDKYGVSNPMKDPNINSKVVETKNKRDPGFLNQRKKFESTMLERYGVKNALQAQEFKDKLNETISQTGKSGRFHTPEWDEAMIKKYGTTIPYKNDSIKSRGINTLIERYGVTSPMKLDWVKEKSKQTCLEKYGVEYSFQSENNKIKSKQTLIERYGVTNGSQLTQRISKINKLIGESLGATEYEFPIGFKRYDIKLGNILFEINPTVSHNSDVNYKYGLTDKEYHLQKTNLAINSGYRCFNIWDWDNIDKIIHMFSQNNVKIKARDCEVALIDKTSSDEFLDEFHLQNHCIGDMVRVGIIYGDTLYGVMTFGNPRYNSNYDVELLRLCFRFGTHIIGGVSKMMNFFIKTYHPNNIISYCDNSKFNGEIYNIIGFKKISSGTPTPHWYNIKTQKHITDNLLRQRGFDQLLGDEYGRFGKGTDNESLMLKNGFVRVYDCGQSVYVWENINGN